MARPVRRAAFRAGFIALGLWVIPVGLLLAFAGGGNVFTEIALFFSRMAVVTFGGAHAALAYVAQAAVHTHGWLTPGETLDGLGMAETTPGPLVMVMQFVGFLAAYREAGWAVPLAAAALGGLLATWVTFAPCFAWIFLSAPFVEDLRGNIRLAAALRAVTAAVVGVILNLAVWFGFHVLFDRRLAARFRGAATRHDRLGFDGPLPRCADRRLSPPARHRHRPRGKCGPRISAFALMTSHTCLPKRHRESVPTACRPPLRGTDRRASGSYVATTASPTSPGQLSTAGQEFSN